MKRLMAIIVASWICGPVAVQAQETTHLSARGWPGDHTLQEPQIPTSSLIVGSALGWTAGLAAGAGIGYLIQPDPGESYVGASEWWWGAWLGSAIGAAAGAHLVNRGRGNLMHGVIGSLLVVPALAIVTLPVGGAGVLLAPVVQVGVTVSIERGSSANPRN